MEEIVYQGERLIPGILGNLFVIIAFVAALVSTIGFFQATQKSDSSWSAFSKVGFLVHGFAVLGIVGTLFYMLANNMFEYHYVWQHSNSAMPMRYIFSSFWEGQEGSFLLWTFWHVVLGFILLKTAGKWVNPVMAVFSSVQLFLTSMILGIYILEYKIGSNPFTVLLREHPDFESLPIFSNPNYLDVLDGRGLNPLLQNYWMTIHPPTLFLGFASTLVPFAFGIAGLWKKEYTQWLRPATPWAFFSVMILGTGILMGGAWAYEALSFGGFWAWDPVENASLVPWLTLVGGAHLMMIQRNKGTSLVGVYALIFATFILILYSTFLTRSGVLGNASVHAFTDLGMSGQLLVYLLAYLVLSIVLIAVHYKNIPKAKKEEETWSREFWMFIGSLVLLISAFQISFTTSIPVINKVFGTNMAPPTDPIEHYNAWQIPFAIIILLMMGFTQFLRYKHTEFLPFLKKILTGLILSLIVSIGIGLSLKMTNPYFLFMLFAATYTIVGNGDYWARMLRGKLNHAGASVAHIGFGMIMLGALISTGSSDIISQNQTTVDISQLGDDFKNNENILLIENDTLPMGDYYVAYRGKEKEGIFVRYQVDYLTRNPKGEFDYAFTLKPFIQTNPRMGNVSEPDTRHFLHKDIYTHVTYADLEVKKPINEEEFEEPRFEDLKVGDTTATSNVFLVLENIVPVAADKKQNLELRPQDIGVIANLKVYSIDNSTYSAAPILVVQTDTSRTYSIPAKLEQAGLHLTFEKLNPETEEVTIGIYEKKSAKKDFIIMKAIVFPGINILWSGCILLILGTVLAIRHRLKLAKK